MPFHVLLLLAVKITKNLFSKFKCRYTFKKKTLIFVVSLLTIYQSNNKTNQLIGDRRISLFIYQLNSWWNKWRRQTKKTYPSSNITSTLTDCSIYWLQLHYINEVPLEMFHKLTIELLQAMLVINSHYFDQLDTIWKLLIVNRGARVLMLYFVCPWEMCKKEGLSYTIDFKLYIYWYTVFIVHSIVTSFIYHAKILLKM